MSTQPIAEPVPTFDRRVVPPLLHVLHECEALQALVDARSQRQVDANADLRRRLGTKEMAAMRQHCVEVGDLAQIDMRDISTTVAELVSSLHREIQDRELVEHELAAAYEQQEASHHASLHDALTGMPNRALFNDRLEQGIAQARRHSWDLAVMFIDLDNFKKINDGHGHFVGDAVLRAIAGRLRDSTRIDDTVSRHGGDEFTYLALDIRDNTSVSGVARKLIDVIGAPCAVNVDGLDLNLRVRASIGIALFPAHGSDVETLLGSADRAMYQAKKSGAGYAFAD